MQALVIGEMNRIFATYIYTYMYIYNENYFSVNEALFIDNIANFQIIDTRTELRVMLSNRRITKYLLFHNPILQGYIRVQ